MQTRHFDRSTSSSKRGQIRDQFAFWAFDPPSLSSLPPSPPPPSPPRLPPADGPTDNIFFAVQPDSSAARQSVEAGVRIRTQHGLRGHMLEDQRCHVSLLGFGLVTELPTVIEFANRVAATISVRSFDAAFDRVLSFSGKSRRSRKHPIVLVGDRTQGLGNLQQALLDGINSLGFSTRKRKFTPHMTLLYDEKDVPEQMIEPVSWRVREFVLIQSHVGQSRYTVLGRWSLLD